MGLMFSRRRADAAKAVAANKAKAHAENHRRAKIAHKDDVHPAEIQKQEQDKQKAKADADGSAAE